MAAAPPQPDSDLEAPRTIAAAMKGLDGPLLPILQAVSDRWGYIDDAAIAAIALVLNLSRAEVHGVASFYADFRRTPPGRHRLKVCRAEACQAMGAMALIDDLERRLGTALGQTSRDGRVTLEAVYCLGNCALAPAAQVDGELVGRADAARLIERVR